MKLHVGGQIHQFRPPPPAELKAAAIHCRLIYGSFAHFTGENALRENIINQATAGSHDNEV